MSRSSPVKSFYLWGFFYLITAFLIVCPTYFLWTSNRWIFPQNGYDYFLNQYSFFGLSTNIIKCAGLYINCSLFLVFAGIFLHLSILISKNSSIISWRLIFWLLGASVLIMGLGIPNQSFDVFFYLAKGWLEVRYGVDVFKNTIADTLNYNQDPMFSSVTHAFHYLTGNYGAFFQLCMALIAKFGSGNLKLTFILFKLINIPLFIGSAFLVRILASRLGFNAKLAFFIFIFNPISIYNMVTASHNDSFVLFAMLLGVYFSINRRAFLTGAMLGVAVGLKMIAILLIPLFVIYFLLPWNNLQSWRNALLFLCGLLLVIFVAYWIYPSSFDYLASYGSYNYAIYYRCSIYLFVAPIMKFLFDCPDAIFTKMSYLVFLFIFGIIFFRILLKNKPLSPCLLVYLCSLVFSYFIALSLLIVCEWYALWPLAFAAIIYSRNNSYYCYNLAFSFMPFTIFFVQDSLYMRIIPPFFAVSLMLYGTFRFMPIMGWLKGREPLD